jgi:hypothetical protein
MKKYRIRTPSSENYSWGVWHVISGGRQQPAADTVARPASAQ